MPIYISIVCCVFFLQVTEQKDYVVHIVPTPSEDEEAGHPGSLLTVTEGWVMTHAKQVGNM